MPEIKELIAAVKTLHSIAEMIQGYDPSPEDLEDLFYLKPDLKESYDKIKNWIIPSSFDGNLVGDDVVTSETVETAIDEAVEEATEEATEETVDEEEETEESTDYSGEDETFLDLLLTLIVERYDGWRVLDAWTEIQNTYVKSGRLPYNKSYKAITKRSYTVNTDKFFELVGDKPGKREKDARIIHVLTDKGPVPATTIKLDETKIIGESFFDKPEFQKRISSMPKFIYMPIVVKLLQHKGNVSEIIDEAKDSVEKLMMIARVKSALIAVKKFTEYDDITVAILAANSIMKNGTRKPKKVQTELRNQFGVLLRDDTWRAIINKEFHPEITDVFFK